MMKYKYIFGPVPSRRLGFSLGINNIPYKICSYSCIYCQLGRTITYSVVRRPYGNPLKIVREIRDIMSENVKIDFITFVPDGEPTLDSNIGSTINMLKSEFEIPIAILTNSSLLWMEDVVEDLMDLDLVSLKVDTVVEGTWRRINRPHSSLDIDKILESLRDFSKIFKGEIITETMLVRELNTHRDELEEIARFLTSIKPVTAYISVPIRPPAEKWVRKPSEKDLVMAYEIFSRMLGKGSVELLNLPESRDFQVHGDPIHYILSTVRVHPLRYEYAVDILSKYGLDADAILSMLVMQGRISIVEYEGNRFIIAKV